MTSSAFKVSYKGLRPLLMFICAHFQVVVLLLRYHYGFSQCVYLALLISNLLLVRPVLQLLPEMPLISFTSGLLNARRLPWLLKTVIECVKSAPQAWCLSSNLCYNKFRLCNKNSPTSKAILVCLLNSSYSPAFWPA